MRFLASLLVYLGFGALALGVATVPAELLGQARLISCNDYGCALVQWMFWWPVFTLALYSLFAYIYRRAWPTR